MTVEKTNGRVGGFEVELRRNGGISFITVSGELDIATAPYLRDTFRRVQANRSELFVLDLASVSFMDTSGAHALLSIHRDTGNALRVILSPAAARIIDLCNLRSALPILEG